MAARVLPNPRITPGDFDILADEGPLLDQSYPPIFGQAPVSSNILGELPIDQHTLAIRYPQPSTKLEVVDSKPNPSKLLYRGQHRRPPIGDQTFQPLIESQADSSALSGWEQSSQTVDTSTKPLQVGSTDDFSAVERGSHPLVNATNNQSVEKQVQKQLAGQFDWILAYPARASASDQERSSIASRGQVSKTPGELIFGCNLLRRTPCSSSSTHNSNEGAADTYTFIATPLAKPDTMLRPPMEDLEDQVNMALHHQMTPVTASLKAPEIVEVIEQAASPSLSNVSERSGSFTDHLSPEPSFAGSRIEDSLEELDKLEDELEAVSTITSSGQKTKAGPGKSPRNDDASPTTKGSSTGKRVTIAVGQSATVRAKPGEKMKPALRRSTSLTFRDKTENEGPSADTKTPAKGLTRARSTNFRPADSKTPVKSSKPLTVPKFELPGEAVSRRLKEQREARQAQQAEAETRKAHAVPTRSKSLRVPTKPDFELPGEAISRRKREERAARLKAQEEEERSRREFKARPFKSNVAPATLPRDNVASRARQGLPVTKGTRTTSNDNKQSNRLSTYGSYERQSGASSTAATMPLSRGRNSLAQPQDEGSRATSMSSTPSEKRSSLSAEDAVQQRYRGKQIYTRDNSYAQEREREKRERESTAALAREQAAERSRAASREWAEKKRQREAAQRQAMRARQQTEAQ